jgi:hypothetical protein
MKDTYTYDKFQKILRTFYVHHGTQTSQLVNVELKERNINGLLLTDSLSIPPTVQNIRENPRGRIKHGMKGILNEAHIYLKPDSDNILKGPIILNDQQIESIYIIQYAGSMSALVVVGTIAGFVIVIANTKSSCPYIYALIGNNFVFEGEIYSGAVLHNLERHDYMHLPSVQPKNGRYSIRIANELKERQYINLAELFVVNHPKDSKVFFTEEGEPIGIISEILPSKAISQGGIDQLAKLIERDTLGFAFDETGEENQHVVLTFDKPDHSDNATLLLRGKNTEWGDYVFGEFAQKFGNKFNKWNRTLKKKSRAERLQGVIDTEMPLTVSMKNGYDWEQIDYFYMVGPLGEREMVLPIDLSKHSESQVEIKLSTGFHFWDVNYAAMDFSDPVHFQFETIQPTEIESAQKINSEALAFDDDKYLEQKKTGDQVDLHFKTIDVPIGMTQSVFLHCKGYYEHVRHFRGKPDIAELEKFKEPGHFSAFSRLEYLKQVQELEAFVSNK